MRAPSLHLTAQAIAVGSANRRAAVAPGKKLASNWTAETHEVDLTPVQPRSERSEYEQTLGLELALLLRSSSSSPCSGDALCSDRDHQDRGIGCQAISLSLRDNRRRCCPFLSIDTIPPARRAKRQSREQESALTTIDFPSGDQSGGCQESTQQGKW